MRNSYFLTFGYFQQLIVLAVSTDFENAHVIGTPRIECSPKSIGIYFETNTPFQGRISVFGKMFTPTCNHDYSSNIQNNATFHMNILQCTESMFLTNGSRILKAHVGIGFHPLVMTNSDRLYYVECLDNSILPIINHSSHSVNCTHLIRLASEWKSMTEFKVGDAIVHEWNCQLSNPGKMQTFLTNCDAVSQSGQTIHLIDENGCVIDAELMGDVVYNNHIPKLYARARIFKFMADEKYRIECFMEFCRDGSSCEGRPFPPKCAFTKDEIIKRSKQMKTEKMSMTNIYGIPVKHSDFKLRISSAWLTIQLNEYTETKNLSTRFHLKTVLNPLLNYTSVESKHFLRTFAFKKIQDSPIVNDKLRTQGKRMDAAQTLHSSRFRKVPDPQIILHEKLIGTTSYENETVSRFGNETKKLKNDKPPISIESTEITSAHLSFELYTIMPAKKVTPTTPYGISPGNANTADKQKEDRTVNNDDNLSGFPVVSSIHRKYDKFISNNADWRLDDKAINDSDLIFEKTSSYCTNATIVSKQCIWSGVENLLLVWSFASLLVWMLLIAVFLHRYARRKPQWMSFREHEIGRMAQSRVLGQDYPWLHPDAFEDSCKNKNGIEINSL